MALGTLLDEDLFSFGEQVYALLVGNRRIGRLLVRASRMCAHASSQSKHRDCDKGCCRLFFAHVSLLTSLRRASRQLFSFSYAPTPPARSRRQGMQRSETQMVLIIT